MPLLLACIAALTFGTALVSAYGDSQECVMLAGFLLVSVASVLLQRAARAWDVRNPTGRTWARNAVTPLVVVFGMGAISLWCPPSALWPSLVLISGAFAAEALEGRR